VRATANAPFAVSVVELIAPDGQPAITNVDDLDASQVPAVGAWSHWKIEATITSPSGSISVQIDDHPRRRSRSRRPIGVAAADRALTLGLTARGALAAFQARVDNVTYIGSSARRFTETRWARSPARSSLPETGVPARDSASTSHSTASTRLPNIRVGNGGGTS